MSQEIKLDDLLQNQPNAPAKIMDEKEASILAKNDLPVLTDEERKKINAIKENLDLRDASIASFYGTDSERNMAEFSDSILSQVRSKNAGDVGKNLTALLVAVKNNPPKENQGFLSKLFHGGKMEIERIIASYDSLSGQIDQISAQLQNQQKDLMKEIEIFQRLYQENLFQYQELGLYIMAGEEKVKEMREKVLPKLYEEAKASENPMAMQVVQDLEENVNRFENKVHELKISQTLALQTAPQIKLIQNNNQLLVDKINHVISNTLPLWRSQTVIALGLAKQEEALRVQKAVSDATNALIKDNAKKLKQTTLGIKEESERSLVDIEALEAANKDLIDTINGSVEISRQAKAKRAEAEEKMVQIKNDLRQALVHAMEESQN